VTVQRPVPDLAPLDRWTVAEAAAELAALEDRVEVARFGLPSRVIPSSRAVAAYAAEVLERDRPLGDALAALSRDIHQNFTYKSGATSVSTTLEELLRKRLGVCQDFAHLAIGCLRSVGLPARYVSGYLETQPPPGSVRLQGADASHAWVSVLTPHGQWIDLDPTNDQQPDSRYIVAAWGRDFADVSPMKGVIFTEGKSSTLDVGVDVIRLEDALPGMLAPGLSGTDSGTPS
jgi:transglutaminase-like putative cysteine protease